jgi:cytochrome b561
MSGTSLPMTQLSQSTARYSGVAIALHWLIAVLIAINFVAAWIADLFPKPQATQIMANHKAFGITILLLSLVRLAWRLGHRPPADLPMQRWESKLAHMVHRLLYALMIGIPLVGWVMISLYSGGKPVSVFGLFGFPGLPLAANHPLGETFAEIHGSLAIGMLVLLGLHLAGALKHQILERKPELRRILPWG